MESIETKTTDIRTIYKTEEFEEFYNDLNARVKDKFEYTFELVQTVYALPVKYIKHLDGTDLYERKTNFTIITINGSANGNLNVCKLIV